MTPAPLRLVVATGNPGKLREFQALLRGMPFELVSQKDLGIETPEETGASFLDNALLKARFAARAAGTAALADDSGLEVDALGGAPGIYSARYAWRCTGAPEDQEALRVRGTGWGGTTVDEANNASLLNALRSVPPERRRARYRCVLVMLYGGPEDPRPLIAEGVWEGMILDAPRGQGGFGYDPLFWVPDLAATAAELSQDEKNRRSHRGIAMRALRSALEARLEQPPATCASGA